MPISIPNVRKLKSQDYLEQLSDGSASTEWLVPLVAWLRNSDKDPEDFFASVSSDPIIEQFPWENPDFNLEFLTWFTLYIWEQARLCGRGDNTALKIIFDQWLTAKPILVLRHFPVNQDILSSYLIPHKLMANLASNIWQAAISN